MTSARSIRLGTRRSKLALAQSGMVADQLRRISGRPVELVELTTYGDTSTEALTQLGGTGVFVNTLREALLAGRIDVAVHSLKDLPTAAPDGLVLAAIPEREDPRDVLVARDGHTLDTLPPGARIGTGSPRRAAQLALWALDHGRELETVPIRGNVDTRLGYVADGRLDGVVLARAGLARLGLLQRVTEVLSYERMLPAPGQGALAVECADGRADLLDLLAVLDHAPTRAAVTAERTVLAELEAGCSAPVGAHADMRTGGVRERLDLTAVVASSDGVHGIRLSTTGDPGDPRALGHELAARMLARGAVGLMGERV